MKYAKLVAMGCAVVLGTAGLTGCSKTIDTTQTSEAEDRETVSAQVTAADDIKESRCCKPVRCAWPDSRSPFHQR